MDSTENGPSNACGVYPPRKTSFSIAAASNLSLSKRASKRTASEHVEVDVISLDLRLPSRNVAAYDRNSKKLGACSRKLSQTFHFSHFPSAYQRPEENLETASSSESSSDCEE